MVDKVEDGIFGLSDDELDIALGPVATDKLIQVCEQLYFVVSRIDTSQEPITGEPIDKSEFSDMDTAVSEVVAELSGGEQAPFVAVEAYRGKQEKRRLLSEMKTRVNMMVGRLKPVIDRRRERESEGA